MKKFLMTALCVAVAIMVFSPSYYAQKKKRETAKERKERIARMVNESASKKNFFIAISRYFPKNGVGQEVIYSTDGYFIDVQKDRISCNLPYVSKTASEWNQAYNLSNTNMNICCDNQITTLMGGWSESQKSYMFMSIFWNNNTDKDTQAIQVTMTIQIYPSGKVYAMVEIPGKDSISYEGEIDVRPKGLERETVSAAE